MDIFTLGVLRRIVELLPEPSPFFLTNFFRTEQRETSEEIHFDIDTGKRRIAPFVAPIVAGQVVESQGYITKMFKPAYIKDKRVFDSSRPFKRSIGERIGGEMSPAQRMQGLLARDLQDQLAMLTRRLEVMAVETLRTGKIVIKGEKYPEVLVDFQRHADLTKTLTGAARWGEAGVSPLADLQTWSLEVTKHSGATATTVVMDLKAWQLFSASADVQKLLDRFRGSDRLNSTFVGEGARYMGSTGDFDIWVHSGWYVDPETGASTPYLPDYTVMVLSQNIEGTRCYGAIKDEEAGFQALPFFVKSWIDHDPACRYLLMQTAPLLVPYRVNASATITVR